MTRDEQRLPAHRAARRIALAALSTGLIAGPLVAAPIVAPWVWDGFRNSSPIVAAYMAKTAATAAVLVLAEELARGRGARLRALVAVAALLLVAPPIAEFSFRWALTVLFEDGGLARGVVPVLQDTVAVLLDVESRRAEARFLAGFAALAVARVLAPSEWRVHALVAAAGGLLALALDRLHPDGALRLSVSFNLLPAPLTALALALAARVEARLDARAFERRFDPGSGMR